MSNDYLFRIFEKYKEKNDGLNLNQFHVFINNIIKYETDIKSVSLKKTMRVFILYSRKDYKKLYYNEFKNWWKSGKRFSFFKGKNSKLLKKAYTLYTFHTNCFKMDNSEFSNLMKKLKIEYNNNDFEFLDQDKDGFIDFYEFCIWLNWF